MIRDSQLHSGSHKPYGGGVRVGGTVRFERCKIGTYAEASDPDYLIEFETSNRQVPADGPSKLTLVDCDLSADSADGAPLPGGVGVRQRRRGGLRGRVDLR